MSFQLPTAIADSLLDKLGHDDAFRACFAQDPRTALASLGFEPAVDARIDRGIWMCLAVDELASKENIVAAAGQLRRQLTAHTATFNPISLEVARSKIAA
jgi:putative modified peptide